MGARLGGERLDLVLVGLGVQDLALVIGARDGDMPFRRTAARSVAARGHFNGPIAAARARRRRHPAIDRSGPKYLFRAGIADYNPEARRTRAANSGWPLTDRLGPNCYAHNRGHRA